jgi:hypothetical protein
VLGSLAIAAATIGAAGVPPSAAGSGAENAAAPKAPAANLAPQVVGSQFNAGNIISDSLFFDSNAMTEAGIQSFLSSKIGSCSNSNCLNVLRTTTRNVPAVYSSNGTLVCNPYAGAGTETAAAIIFKVQQACGISAKVLLVTLQKEQSLVTRNSVTLGVLERAMGYGCPDTTGGACASQYYGFFNQVYEGAWQLKRYGTSPVFGYFQPGNKSIQWNPNANCGSTVVNIQNRATAALYNYTPYQPNAPALNNLYGLGDGCSAYGNRNFWAYYNDWFGSSVLPVGSPEGGLDTVVPATGSLTLSGWAVDPDAPTASVNVSVQVDSQWFLLVADKTGTDFSSRYPGAGNKHNFSGTIQVAPGTRTMCIYLGNRGAGSDGTLGCRQVQILDTSPRGEIRDIWTSIDGISLWGWAADTDAPNDALAIRVVVNRTATYNWIADQPWAPIGQLLPGVGINHGWGSTVKVPGGDYSVCVFAVNRGAGSDTALGCRSVTVASASPKAELKDIWTTTAGVSMWGWAIDPDALTSASTISIRAAGKWYAWRADQSYPAAANFVPGAGNNHGWGGTIDTGPGTHSVCLWVGNQNAGSDLDLGCRTVVVPDGSPKGQISGAWGSAGGVSLWGWAIDPDVPTEAMKLSIQLDSSWYVWDANQPYAPAAAFVAGAGDNHGWGGTLPASPGAHTVCVYPINIGGGAPVSFGCQTVVVPDASPVGEVRGIWTTPAGISLWGWAIDPDALDQPVPLSIQVGSSWYSWSADQPYAPAQAYVAGAGPNHGWGATAPAPPGQHTVCVYPVNRNQGDNTSLGCYTVTVPVG